MYIDYYKLKEEPFQITPDPKFAWLGEKHAEALASLIYCIEKDKGFLVLTGDVGTGKTLMINCLLNNIDSSVIVVRVPNPKMSLVDFLHFLSAKFKWEKNFNTKGEFLLHLEDFLYQVHAEEKKVLLIIDEAQQLSNYLLEEIRLLSNIELEYKKLIKIFFVGQIELTKILGEERNKALRERIEVWYHIDPLNEHETAQYINYRLGIAGSDMAIFKKEATQEIYFFSRGIPRQINILCDQALLVGYSLYVQEIDANIIRECAEDIRINFCEKKIEKPEQEINEIGIPPDKIPYKKMQITLTQAFGALSFILLIIIGYLLYNSRTLGIDNKITRIINTYSENKDIKPTKQSFLPEEIQSQIPSIAYDPKETQVNLSFQPHATIEDDIKEEPQSDMKNESSFLKENLIVHFKHNSNEINDDEFAKLELLAEFMTNNSDTKIKVKGYTDNSGPREYNNLISRLRAIMVKTYLVSKGISPSRIGVFGLGPENPIASNKTLQGRMLNRRVEVELDIDNAENFQRTNTQ